MCVCVVTCDHIWPYFEVAAWPVKRESEGDMTEEEKRAVAETKKVWPLAKDYMDKADMWKKEKEVVEEGEQGVGKIELFTAKCSTLSHKVFKVTVSYNLRLFFSGNSLYTSLNVVKM